MVLRQVILRDGAELARWHEPWQELLARSNDDEPVLAPFWLAAWWRVFGGSDGRKLRVLLLFDGERLAGVVPLVARRHWYRGMPFRRLEALGSGEPEADEICSEYLGLVAERGAEADVVAALANALASGRLGTWDELVVPAMRGDAPLPALLSESLERAGYRSELRTTAECPYIALPESYDEYLAALASPQRRFVKRTLERFDAWAHGDAELHAVTTPGELERGSAVLRALHGERWSGAGERGVFASPRFRSFHDEVMRALFERGALELFWLGVRGEPVAALYNFVWNGKVYFYQSGRKLDVPDDVRPGIALHLHAIRRAIEAGRREYDFLGGASQYKRKLATASRPLVTLRAVGSPVRELARSALERGVGVVRDLVGPLTPRRYRPSDAGARIPRESRAPGAT